MTRVRRRAPLIGLLFFVSGFTGLVYEVIWAKYLALVLGSTAYAQVGVLAMFMGGLALGSLVWGRYVDRSRRALRLYGALEIGIGLSAAAFVLSFDALRDAYWAALAHLGAGGVGDVTVKVALCVVAMLPATFCMGGTLPVLSRALGLDRPGLGRGVAYLYAVNSLGAAVGGVVTGFYLVARWGFDAPFWGAAVVNFAVGVVAVVLGRVDVGASTAVASAARSASAEVARETRDIRGYAALVMLAAAVSGAVAMIDEVAWIRLCGLALGSSTYSFSIMLAAFISGIAAGSLVYTLVDPAGPRPLRFFAYTSLAAALVLLACLPFYERLPYEVGRLTAVLRQHDVSFVTHQAATLVSCLLVMLPLTFISGLNFPALTQAAGQARAGIGRPVSHVLFANTAGTIVGTVLGGLYLLPALGLRGTFLVGVVATVAVAVLVVVCDAALPGRRWIATVSLLGLAGYCAWAPAWDLRLLVAGEFRRHQGVDAASFADYLARLEQQIEYYRDGSNATVSVERYPAERDSDGEVTLKVNGKADASVVGDRDTQLLSGHLPAILHPGSRRALVIGYGSGMTTGALLQHPIESVDVIEISPEVIAADAQFRASNHDPLHDPRTHLFIEDARTFLYRTPQQYDLIISEPSNPWIAGISNLFTAEFFAQVRSRLTPDGVLVQWFHSYETSNELVALILRSVAHEFADVRIFQPNRWDVFLIASPSVRVAPVAAMREEFAHAGDLGQIGITRLTTVLALETAPADMVRRLAGTGPLNRDRVPLLEYGAPRAFFDGKSATLLASIDLSGADRGLPLRDLSAADYAEIAAYVAAADLGQHTQMLRVMTAWLARAPTDPVALRWLGQWMSAHAGSPFAVSALVRAAELTDPTTAPEYARLLLRVVRSSRLTPAARDVDAIAPVVQAAARQPAGGAALLDGLGGLYAAAGASDRAQAAFAAARALPVSTPAGP